MSTVETRRGFGGALQLRRHAPELAFVGLLLLGAAIVLYETRGLSFYFDDWEFVLHRRGLTPDVLLGPHGPHLTLIPILVYKFLLQLFGGTSYLPFRFLAALDLAALAAVVGVVCRRGWGRWWGLAPVLLLVTLGSGAWSLLWPFQVGYAVADAAGLIALVTLSKGGRDANAIACLALILSLASGSEGVGFIVGGAVLLVLRGGWRRSAWVVVLPAVLYGLWYLKYGQQASETHLSLWRASLPYAMKSFSSTISGLLGLGSPSSDLPPQLDPSFGEPVALAAIVAIAVALWRGWRPPTLFWAVLATLVVLWLAASLSNQAGIRRPTDSRYLPTNAILLMVCVCAALPRPTLRAGGVVVAILTLVIVSATNAGQFTAVRNQMLSTSIASRAELGAMFIMRGLVPPQFTPVPPFSTGLVNDVEAGPLFSAVDAFGIIADDPAALVSQDEGTRELTDQVLSRGELLGLSFRAARHAPFVPPPAVISGTAKVKGGCLLVGGNWVVVRASPGTVRLTAAPGSALSAAAGRFANTFDVPLGIVPAGRTATVHVPADRAPQIPWRMFVSGRGRVCA